MPVALLKVSTRSGPNAVAGAIAAVLRESHWADVQVIGAGALNQAVKALAIARAFLAPEGIDPVFVPSFQDVEIDGQPRTAIRLHIEDRNYAGAREAPSGREAAGLREAT